MLDATLAQFNPHYGSSLIAGVIKHASIEFPSYLKELLKMKGYLILDFSIKDFSRFKEYIEKIPAFIEKHSGKYIVQGVEAAVMEGDWQPERVVILEFPSTNIAKGFLEDPEAQPLFSIRHNTTDSKLILVEGCF